MGGGGDKKSLTREKEKKEWERKKFCPMKKVSAPLKKYFFYIWAEKKRIPFNGRRGQFQ